MKILITTQYRENYGTAADPYWKSKGGYDYFILNVDPMHVAPGLLVAAVQDQIEYSNDGAEEYILDWELVEDDYVTYDEKLQLEYDGKITFPTQILTVA